MYFVVIKLLIAYMNYISFSFFNHHSDWASLATRKPSHVHAMRLAGKMYESYVLERYMLKKVSGGKKFEIRQI